MTTTVETAADTVVVSHQIQQFVSEILRDDEVTIGLLRYGAHIPHIYQRARYAIGVRPMSLLLSHMIDFMPPSFFQGKRFLILDDSVYRGTSMRRLVEKLTTACKVPRQNIRRAALVIDEGCAEPDKVVDAKIAILNHQEYMAWKETLTELIRTDVRPTERDHPLYYFGSLHLSLGSLLDVSQDIGAIHMSPGASETLCKFSLTIDAALLDDLQIPGLSIGNPCKIRFYCDEDRVAGTWRLTAVPFAATVVDVPQFVEGGGSEILASAVGLPKEFFRTLPSAGQIIGDETYVRYFFINRAVAACLLERCLRHMAGELRKRGYILTSLQPTQVDGVVNYIFPSAYEKVFHPSIFRTLDAAVKGEATSGDGKFRFEEPSRLRTQEVKCDPLMREATQLLSVFASREPPVVWADGGWEPIRDFADGITYEEFLRVFGDPVFVSAALDVLLDDGLLRAVDRCVEPKTGKYCRMFLPGGEYHAKEVDRLAKLWVAIVRAADEKRV